MGHEKRNYEIVEAGVGPPLQAPQNNPVLSENGHVIPSNVLLDFNKTTDRMKKVDHYRIRFEIMDFVNSRLRFAPNINDVMWAQKGTGKTSCPTSACHMPGTFWVDEPMHPHGKWIDVINMDMTKEEFWFTLNLVDKNNPTSTTFVPVDPGGGNQNGGGAGSFTFNWLAPTVLGVCAGVVAFFGAKLLLT